RSSHRVRGAINRNAVDRKSRILPGRGLRKGEAGGSADGETVSLASAVACDGNARPRGVVDYTGGDAQILSIYGGGKLVERIHAASDRDGGGRSRAHLQRKATGGQRCAAAGGRIRI